MENTPKETLYIKNLCEKVSPQDTKHALYYLFMQYGNIHEIVVKKSNALRGQAFIVFSDVTAATQAKAKLQGFLLFGKQISIHYAKNRCENLMKLEGKYVPNKKKRQKYGVGQKKDGPDEDDYIPQKGLNQIIQQGQKKNQNQNNDTVYSSNQQEMQMNPVNSELLLEDLPGMVTQEMLEQLFGQFPGFVEIRHIHKRHIAFIEFASEQAAAVAVTGLQGFQLAEGQFLRINYSKKV